MGGRGAERLGEPRRTAAGRPSAHPRSPSATCALPREATRADIDEVVASFARAARFADLAGYQAVEIQGSHGYLVHEFLSPLVNRRTDKYGGSAHNRMRMPLRVVRAVRAAFPQEKPVFFRITATDWIAGGLALDKSTAFAKELAAVGIDLLDVSSGLVVRDTAARPPVRQGVHVAFADALKTASGLAVAPAGQIEDLSLAGGLVASGRADAVMIGRALLRDPYLPLRGLIAGPAAWPAQYRRAL
ncbi:hypothetical protein OG520_00345 [Streptomyces sp. NBC_00984]|uniref:oxidoreductase n=1 Tax=Streptomyces sp. NBC_00984 TaxID=2903700 RepID=UPI003866CAFE|nr:hypothetical protein OG520_00345 [Streptomyces sp. NBC_00984]